MKKTHSLLIATLLSTLPLGAQSDEAAPEPEKTEAPAASTTEPAKDQGSDSKKSSWEKTDKGDKAQKDEKPREKAGRVTLGGGGGVLDYVAQTGTIPVLKEDGGKRADVFYTFYAARDSEGRKLAAKDPKRPIMFCFNGGPGASSVWLHLGGLAPRRVDMPPEGLTPASVARVVENPNTILDATDLVFVDPVNTGLSRAAKGEKPEQFFGVEEDIRAVGEFVRLFTTREQRWSSPKYLCGESYGVLRVSGLADYLQAKHGMYPEGLVLVSGLVDYQTILAGRGNDLPYILFLPTMTATAHYHNRLVSELQADLDKTVTAARAFAQGEYTLALLRGNTLDPLDKKRVAEKLAIFTGLTTADVLKQDLRVDPSFFRKALLRDEEKVVGRFDSRVVGLDNDPGQLRSGYDPSYSNIAGGFASAINSYIREELGYESDHPYHILNSGLGWKWHNFENRYVSTGENLASAIQNNPNLRILVLCGRRDLAVPEDSMRYSLSHLPIPPASRENIRFSLYESGHMMYLLQSDAEKLRADLKGFIR